MQQFSYEVWKEWKCYQCQVWVKYPGDSMSCGYEISENKTISVFVYMPPYGSKNIISTFKYTTIDVVEVLDSNGLIFIKRKND